MRSGLFTGVCLTLLTLTIVPAQAWAAENYTPVPPQPDQPNTPLVTWDRFCRQLVNHRPLSNVAYQPAAPLCDANGNPVAPANVPNAARAVTMPPDYRIFITSAQATALGVKLPPSPVAVASDMLVGEVTVGADGTVRYNGRRIDQEPLYKVCESFAK